MDSTAPTAAELMLRYQPLVERAARLKKPFAAPRLYLGSEHEELSDGVSLAELAPPGVPPVDVLDAAAQMFESMNADVMAFMSVAGMLPDALRPAWAGFASEGWMREMLLPEVEGYEYGTNETLFEAGDPTVFEGAMAYVVTQDGRSSFSQAKFQRQSRRRLTWAAPIEKPDMEIAGGIPTALARIVGVAKGLW